MSDLQSKLKADLALVSEESSGSEEKGKIICFMVIYLELNIEVIVKLENDVSKFTFVNRKF